MREEEDEQQSPLYTKALHFAKEKHEGQVRKVTGESYVEHCIRVSKTLRQFEEVTETVCIAALLHDTLEDTETTIDELEEHFGKEVAELVSSLTNSKEGIEEAGSKGEYLRIKLRGLSSDALLIKLSDRLDNTSDLCESENREWVTRYADETWHAFIDNMKEIKCDTVYHLILFGKIHENIRPYSTHTSKREEDDMPILIDVNEDDVPDLVGVNP